MTMDSQPSGNPAGTREVATLAGGCFWCLEAVYELLRGIDSSVSGYTGGQLPHPTYEEVCSGATGHAEVVQLTYDPAEISYADLLDVFFTIHDPTTLNRQGNDAGTQYRSAIYTHSPAQDRIARETIARLTAEHVWPNPIVTEVTPLPEFYPAEPYHQHYYANHPENGYCRVIIEPKVATARSHYLERLKR